MSKLKLRFMVAVLEYIIDMYNRRNDPKQVNKLKKLRDDIVTELGSV